jgi:ABC-type uncharacterized transport system ATPase component
MVTHEHSLVERFNRRVVELHGGKITSDTGKINSKILIKNEIAPPFQVNKKTYKIKDLKRRSQKIEVSK